MKEEGLSPKRLAFVNEYVQCWNASRAARRAGYSAKTAHAAGSFLLRIPEVLDEIAERQRQHSMSANEALARLTDQARESLEPFIRISRDDTLDFDLTSPEALDHLHLIKKIRVKRRRGLEAGQ
jgi:phage terminase small subunit